MEAYSTYTKILKIADLAAKEHSKLNESYDETTVDLFLNKFLRNINAHKGVNIYEATVASQYHTAVKRHARFKINDENRAK